MIDSPSVNYFSSHSRNQDGLNAVECEYVASLLTPALPCWLTTIATERPSLQIGPLQIPQGTYLPTYLPACHIHRRSSGSAWLACSPFYLFASRPPAPRHHHEGACCGEWLARGGY